MGSISGIGVLHTLVALAALGFGLAVSLNVKGTRRHKQLGYAYVVTMVVVNLTALMIYRLYGRFGPFHALAIFNLTSVVVGFASAYRRRPRGRWLEFHAITLAWSYVGLVAAFIAEIGVRVLRLGFGWSVGGGLVLSMFLGGLLIHTRVPKIVSRWRAGAKPRTTLSV
jgi:uncharacterized membrane protein